MDVAVIGLGRMGVRHVEMLTEVGARVVAAAEPREATRAEAAAAAPGLAGARLFADAHAMLAAVRAEAVVIASTAPSHCELTLAAAEAGAAYILCEKPLATSIADARRMVETCRARGVRLAVNHQMRFMEQYTAVRDLAGSEAFGGLTSMNVLAGNFGLAMNGSHYFEAFRFLTEAPAVVVRARFSALDVPNPRGPEFRDAAGVIDLETADGRRLHLDAGADQGHGIHVVYGTRNGRIAVDELTGALAFAVREDAHRAMPTTRYGMPWREEMRRIAPTSVIAPSRAVFEAMLAGVDYPSGETGLATVAALVAAYLSHEAGGRPILLGEDALPEERRFPWA